MNTLSDEQKKELKKKIEEMLAYPNKMTSGNANKMDRQVIHDMYGEETLEKIDEIWKEFGYPFSFHNLKPYDWYHEGYAVGSILILQALYGLTEDDIVEFGKNASKVSFLVRTGMQFISLETTLKMAQKTWSKHYTFGSFSMEKLNMEERYCIIKVVDYPFYPVMPHYLRGFMMQLMGYFYPGGEVRVTHQKCEPENGLSCDLFEIRW